MKSSGTPSWLLRSCSWQPLSCTISNCPLLMGCTRSEQRLCLSWTAVPQEIEGVAQHCMLNTYFWMNEILPIVTFNLASCEQVPARKPCVTVARVYLPLRPIKFWLFLHLLVYLDDLALFGIFLFNSENSREDKIFTMKTLTSVVKSFELDPARPIKPYYPLSFHVCTVISF